VKALTERENKQKTELCKATIEPMHIVDFSKPYVIEVYSSDSTIGAVLYQSLSEKGNKPVAFASQKLTPAQKSWSTIKKEAFAAIWTGNKFRD